MSIKDIRELSDFDSQTTAPPDGLQVRFTLFDAIRVNLPPHVEPRLHLSNSQKVSLFFNMIAVIVRENKNPSNRGFMRGKQTTQSNMAMFVNANARFHTVDASISFLTA